MGKFEDMGYSLELDLSDALMYHKCAETDRRVITINKKTGGAFAVIQSMCGGIQSVEMTDEEREAVAEVMEGDNARANAGD